MGSSSESLPPNEERGLDFPLNAVLRGCRGSAALFKPNDSLVFGLDGSIESK